MSYVTLPSLRVSAFESSGSLPLRHSEPVSGSNDQLGFLLIASGNLF